MLHQKIRYVTGQAVHSGNATPGIISTHEPFTCRGAIPFSQTNRWLANYEEISYTTEKLRQFNDCKHTTFRGIPRMVSSYDIVQLRDITGAVYESYGHNIHSYTLAAAFPHGNLPVDTFGVDRQLDLDTEVGMGGPVMAGLDSFESGALDLDKIASSALKLFYDRFVSLNRGLSVVNFVLELRDIKRLVTSIKQLAQKDEWLKLVSTENLKNLRGVRFRAASNYLSYKFGVNPFIRDLQLIYRTLGSWRKRLKDTLARTHEVVVASANMGAFRYQGGVDPLQVIDFFGAGHCDGITDYAQPAGRVRMFIPNGFTPRAGLKYSLYCEDLSKMNVELRGLMDALGFQRDPAIIWNAIPFSFLLDWVWDVSEWLGRWAKPNLPLQLRIMDFYILWKYQGTVSIETDHLNGALGDTGTVYTTSTERTSVPLERFVRVKFSPDKEHLSLANWDKNVIDKTFLSGSLITTAKVNHPPLRIRKFGPSNLSLKKIARLMGWRSFQPSSARTAAIAAASERLTAKLKRRASRRLR